ncbi:hypothetical protein RvY_07270-3 [Ramazzottius varieornatus]|uniref:Uncharacterized protein n=1 Tax=Ramazzottius varieornatus TaxID=947166 RepID=A0A1D1V1I3_RAMVA|nr:hypothetical protein RvY_07270-3 [Ramazzottius varieornatus]
MEVRDSNEEELKDVWLTLASMGYNFDLSLDKAIVFSLNVGCSDGEPIIAATHIKPTSRLIEKCISRAAVEGDDYEQLEDGILLHKFTTPNRRCLVLQNTSTQERTVESALLESFNCMSSKEFPMRVNLPPNSCEMIAQFVPFDNTLPWRFCTREITE